MEQVVQMSLLDAVFTKEKKETDSVNVPSPPKSELKIKVKKALENIKDDADFFVYNFNPDGTFRSSFENKAFIEDLVNKYDEITYRDDYKKDLIFGDKGVSIRSFDENQLYDTEDTEGYTEHSSKSNKYYNIYINLDKEAKIIEFKLGKKYKKLELIENSGYVSKPHYSKWLKVESADELEKHIYDEWWNPRMVNIGRRVLGIKSVITGKLID